MIEIKNLRIEKIGTKYKLLADISSEKNRTDNESTIWISVDEKYKDSELKKEAEKRMNYEIGPLYWRYVRHQP